VRTQRERERGRKRERERERNGRESVCKERHYGRERGVFGEGEVNWRKERGEARRTRAENVHVI
jgi:hypothetical protein